jgi:hypothetical protein
MLLFLLNSGGLIRFWFFHEAFTVMSRSKTIAIATIRLCVLQCDRSRMTESAGNNETLNNFGTTVS